MSKVESLKKYLKPSIRYQVDDIVFHEPSDIDRDELKEVLRNTMVTKEDGSKESYIGVDGIRTIFDTLIDNANIEDFTDEEIFNWNKTMDRRMVRLMNSVVELLREIMEDIMYEYIADLENLNSILLANKLNQTKTNVNEKLNKILADKNINITMEELQKELSKGKKIEDILKEKSKTTNR